MRDHAVACLSVVIFTIAACPDQRLAAPPGSPCAARPPSIPEPAGTGRLRGLPRSRAPRVRPLLPVRPARPARPGPARRRRGAHLLRGEGLRVRRRSWRYKSWRPPDPAARTCLLALLLTFLHDHGRCVAARGHARPRPSGRRADRLRPPGTDPLLALAAPYLRLPVTGLVIRPGEQGRDPNSNRFTSERTGPGASVLLLDDSWVSGASAQSAAAALRRAGARHVAVVVLGRRSTRPTG